MFRLPAVVLVFLFFSLMKEALCESERKNDTSVLLYQYISARYTDGFATETFASSGTILFACFTHLLQTFCFDFKFCNHYRKRSYFTVVCKENNARLVTKCYVCYR